jgi:hypothetical protein
VIAALLLQALELVNMELARLHMDGIELLSAQVQNSVGLKFFCCSSSAFQLFERRLTTGRMKRSIETVFNSLLKLTAAGAVQITSDGSIVEDAVFVIDIIISNQDSIRRSGLCFAVHRLRVFC